MTDAYRVFGSFPLWLEEVRDRLRDGFRPTKIISGSGTHGVLYDSGFFDDRGEYAVIGFNLPDNVYAEIEDGTYGELQGFRIYLHNDGAHDNEEHDDEECDVCGNRAIVSLNPPRCLGHLPENERPIPESSQHQGE